MVAETEPPTERAATLQKISSRGKQFKAWNGAKGELLGRTGMSWVRIIIFYVIFYAALFAFSWFCYQIFSLTLEENRPKWIMESSRIGINPGLGYRPRPHQKKNPDSTLISYRKGKEADAAFWYEQLEEIIDKIGNSTEDNQLETCSSENGNRAKEGVSCRVDLEQLGNCTKENKFGYLVGQPCILIKLNRIIGWKPEPFGLNANGEYDEKKLKEDFKEKNVPKELQEYINRRVEGIADKDKTGASILDQVWITCDGKNKGDKEAIGHLTYYPHPPHESGIGGIPAYYFPYENQKGYQSPFVFVQLMEPLLGKHINIECRAWARNIHYDRLTRHGSVHFAVKIDH